MPWYRELELERRGARYLEPELNVALILKSDAALCWWTDFERTAKPTSPGSICQAHCWTCSPGAATR